MKSLYYSFSFLCIIFFISFSFSSVFADSIIGDTDLQPQFLEDFSEGCYGNSSSGFRTILLNESKDESSTSSITIGYIYLVENPNFTNVGESVGVPEYNVVLCDSPKELDDLKYFHVNKYFTTEVGTDMDINFIFDDNNGLFIINKNGGNWMLSTDKGITFQREEVRYSLLGLSIEEKGVIGDEENSLRMLASLEFAIKDLTNNKAPRLDLASRLHYNSDCNLRNFNSYCVQILDAIAYVGSEFSLNLHATDDDKNDETQERKTTYSFLLDGEKLLDEDGKWEGEYITGEELFNIFFEFDEITFILKQKEGIELTIEQSPYTIKVSIEEEAVNIADSQQNILLAQNSIPFNLYSEVISQSGLVFTLNISVVEPSTYEASPYSPTPRSVVSGADGGGKDYLIVQRLKNGVEYETIGSPTPSAKVLVCPTKKYNRYPEKRGNGVNANKFTDTNVNHRAYNGLIDLAEQEIVNGDNETGNARLDDTISRAEFVKIMTIAREDTLLLGDCLKLSNFYDVDSEAWYAPFIQNLEQKVIVKGYTDNMYRPGKAINLVEAYKIIALSFDYITLDDAHSIVHNQNIQWYVPYVDALENGGVIPSWMLSYEMNATISRGDMFELLANVLRQKDWLKNVDWN